MKISNAISTKKLGVLNYFKTVEKNCSIEQKTILDEVSERIYNRFPGNITQNTGGLPRVFYSKPIFSNTKSCGIWEVLIF